MNYYMKAGILYPESSELPIAHIKSSLLGPIRKVYLQGEQPALQTDILNQRTEAAQPGNVRNRCYLLTDSEGRTAAEARPAYAKEEDPDKQGWPLCRLPKVDHAEVLLQGRLLRLVMHSSQSYSLLDEKAAPILRITHKGISGGWTLQDDFGFTPDVLCGLFVFCRYLEQESELLIV